MRNKFKVGDKVVIARTDGSTGRDVHIIDNYTRIGGRYLYDISGSWVYYYEDELAPAEDTAKEKDLNRRDALKSTYTLAEVHKMHKELIKYRRVINKIESSLSSLGEHIESIENSLEVS